MKEHPIDYVEQIAKGDGPGNGKENKFQRRARVGRCMVCGRKLTDPNSIKYSIGPICFGRYPGLAMVESEEEAAAVLEEEEAKIREEARRGGGLIHKTKNNAPVASLLSDADIDEPETTELPPLERLPPARPSEAIKKEQEKPHPLTIEEAKAHLSHYKDFGWRMYQREAIEFILRSDKKFIFVEAPTGAGKSLTAMVSGLAKGGTIYSVHSKALQHQITDDFPEAKSLFGRSNYPCQKNSQWNCGECSHTRNEPCLKRGSCAYLIQKKITEMSVLKILNYDYLLAAANYANAFNKSNFNIVDEADNLENTLIGFVTLTFTSAQLRRINLETDASNLKKTSKNKEFLLDSWKTFAQEAHYRTGRIVTLLEETIENFSGDDSEKIRLIKDKTRMVHLWEKIGLFLNNVDATWLFDDKQEDKYIFRPLWLTQELANLYMWRHAGKWVLMSASFLPLKLECRRLGIPTDEVDYLAVPSTFPVERRPIHVESAANLTSKTMEVEVPKLVSRIEEILLDEHPNEKGLIHGVSYKLSQQIMSGVRSNRLIIHDSTNRQEVLNRFKASNRPDVLISPSMDRGVSLEMDMCRFVIVAKAPFLYLGDKIVSARVYSSLEGKDWYAATMLLTVLQMTGRGMRSKDDYCETYILDEQFARVFQQKPSFLPAWWKEAVTW